MGLNLNDNRIIIITAGRAGNIGAGAARWRAVVVFIATGYQLQSAACQSE